MPTPVAQVLPALVATGGLTQADLALTTTEMQAEYTVEAFAAPFVQVTRKSDGATGSLQFARGVDGVRYYFAWVAE